MSEPVQSRRSAAFTIDTTALSPVSGTPLVIACSVAPTAVAPPSAAQPISSAASATDKRLGILGDRLSSRGEHGARACVVVVGRDRHLDEAEGVVAVGFGVVLGDGFARRVD